MYKNKIICFINTVYNSPFEVRMFYKEARTLAAAGYEVVLIVQHDKCEVVDGIQIIPLPKPRNRFDRATRLCLKAFIYALRQRADLFHLHSPELIPIGLFLKLIRKTVIYDAHEAYSEKIMSKPYIKPLWRPLISKVFSFFERISSKYFNHIIAADRFVAKQFKNRNVTVVANYPELSMTKKVTANKLPLSQKEVTIVIYAGGLTKERGLFQMVKAMEYLSDLDVELHLLGRFENAADEQIVCKIEKVKYLGFLPLDKVYSHLMVSHIGLVLLQPVPAYLYAGENTTKLFEYMANGLAIVASDFSNLKQIVEGNNCGICVDPTSLKDIASAIRLLHRNPQMITEMGEKGRQAVKIEYNWEKESSKLLEVYRKSLKIN